MPHCRRTYCYQVRRTFLQFGAYPEEVRRRSVSVDSPQVRWRELSPDIYAWRMERRSKHAAIASQLAGSGEGDGHVSQWREGSPCFSRRSTPLTFTGEETWSAGLIVQVHLVKPLQGSLTTMHTCLVPSNTHRGIHFLPVDSLHDHVSETKHGVRGRAEESEENQVCRNLLPIFDAAFQPIVASAQSDASKQTDTAVIPAPERTWSATPLGGDTEVIARLPSPGGLYRVSCESRCVRHEIVLAAVRAQEATLRIQGETTPSPDPRSIGLGKYNFANWMKDILNALWYRQPYQKIIESPLIATHNDSRVW